MKIGRLLLRAAVGTFFIGHGTHKLLGWFGGRGLKGTAETFESMGLKPGIVHASAAGAAETFGGAGLLLGYRTPLASASIVSVMLTAINRVHLKNGPWATNGGYEYNVVLAAVAVALAESGPGALSLDALRGKERSGTRWGIFSLAAGAAGAAGAHFLAESRSSTAVPASAAATGSANGTDPVVAPVVSQPVADRLAGTGTNPQALDETLSEVAGGEESSGEAPEA
jgi:putative oxidoreductase